MSHEPKEPYEYTTSFHKNAVKKEQMARKMGMTVNQMKAHLTKTKGTASLNKPKGERNEGEKMYLGKNESNRA